MQKSTEYDLQKFGNILLDLRESRNITKRQIRKAIGIHPDTLKFIEYGHKLPSTDTLTRLSDYYKINFLKILDNCRLENSEFLEKINRRIDQMAYHDTLSEVEEIENALTEYIESHSNIISSTILLKAEQSLLLLQLIKIKNKRDELNISISEQTAYKGLHLFHKNFSIKKINDFLYSPVEMRFLLSLAFSFVRQEKNKEAIHITKYVVKSLEKLYSYENSYLSLLLQSYLDLAYILFLVKEDQEALRVCQRGIELSSEKFYFKFLPHLYFRKGVIEYHLDMDYVSSFYSCINSFDLIGDQVSKEKYLDVLSKKYHIVLEDDHKNSLSV